MKRIIKWISLALMLVMLTFSILPGQADFGDYSSDSDWGSDWDSDWDSDWESDWDSDWSSSDSRSRNRDGDSYSMGKMLLGVPLLMLYIGFLVYLACTKDDRRGGSGTGSADVGPTNCRDSIADGSDDYSSGTDSANVGPTNVWDSVVDRENDYSSGSGYSDVSPTNVWDSILNGKKDSGSGSADVGQTKHWNFYLRPMDQIPHDCDTQKIRDLYYRMQESWSKGDISDLEADFTAEAFANYTNQLRAKNERGEHAHCIVHSVTVDKMGWNEDADEYLLAVRVTAVITDWDTDDDGVIIAGSDTKRKQMVYAWEMRKAKGEDVSVKRCPNCGAALTMNAGATCPYCQTHLTAAANRWVLHSIKGIRQKTL